MDQPTVPRLVGMSELPHIGTAVYCVRQIMKIYLNTPYIQMVIIRHDVFIYDFMRTVVPRADPKGLHASHVGNPIQTGLVISMHHRTYTYKTPTSGRGPIAVCICDFLRTPHSLWAKRVRCGF